MFGIPISLLILVRMKETLDLITTSKGFWSWIERRMLKRFLFVSLKGKKVQNGTLSDVETQLKFPRIPTISTFLDIFVRRHFSFNFFISAQSWWHVCHCAAGTLILSTEGLCLSCGLSHRGWFNKHQYLLTSWESTSWDLAVKAPKF